MGVRITCDFSWLGEDAKLEDDRLVFDVQTNPADWLVLGKKKGYFVAEVRNFTSVSFQG